MDNVGLRCKAESVLYKYFGRLFEHNKFCCSFSYDFTDKNKEDKYILSACMLNNNKKQAQIFKEHLHDVFKLELSKNSYTDWLIYDNIDLDTMNDILVMGRFI